MNLRLLAKAAWILATQNEFRLHWSIMRKFGSAAFSTADGGTGPICADPRVGWPGDLPGICMGGFIFSRENFERLEASNTLLFPALCCGCDEPTDQHAEVNARFEGSKRGRFPLKQIPTCQPCQKAQADGSAPLLVKLQMEGHKFESALLVAKSPSFLLQTRDLNDAGKLLPPWFWSSGNEFRDMRFSYRYSAWWDMVRTLSPAARAAYLDEWEASPTWVHEVARQVAVLLSQTDPDSSTLAGESSCQSARSARRTLR